MELFSESSIAGLGFLQPEKTHALTAEKLKYFPAIRQSIPLFQVGTCWHYARGRGALGITG